MIEGKKRGNGARVPAADRYLHTGSFAAFKATFLPGLSLAFFGIGLYRLWYQFSFYNLHFSADMGMVTVGANIARVAVIALLVLLARRDGFSRAARGGFVWSGFVLMTASSVLYLIDLFFNTADFEALRVVVGGVGLVGGEVIWVFFLERLKPGEAFSLRGGRVGAFVRAVACDGVFGPGRLGHGQPVRASLVGVRLLAGHGAARRARACRGGKRGQGSGRGRVVRAGSVAARRGAGAGSVFPVRAFAGHGAGVSRRARARAVAGGALDSPGAGRGVGRACRVACAGARALVSTFGVLAVPERAHDGEHLLSHERTGRLRGSERVSAHQRGDLLLHSPCVLLLLHWAPCAPTHDDSVRGGIRRLAFVHGCGAHHGVRGGTRARARIVAAHSHGNGGFDGGDAHHAPALHGGSAGRVRTVPQRVRSDGGGSVGNGRAAGSAAEGAEAAAGAQPGVRRGARRRRGAGEAPQARWRCSRGGSA